MLMFRKILVVFISLTVFGTQAHSIPPKKKLFLNKYDKMGRRKGKWKVWHDDEKKKISSKGHFKRGNERRTWKYYATDGTLRRIEKYKDEGRLIYTTIYHPNGKVQCSGVAKLLERTSDIHYYWDGDWNYYSDSGKLIKTVTFKVGKEIRVKTY